MLKLTAKSDRWNNFDPNDYQEIIQKFEILEGVKQTHCDHKK